MSSARLLCLGSRPEPSESDSALLRPRVRIGDQTVSTLSTVLRLDTAREVTLSELRIELIYPADEESDRLLRAFASI